MSLPQDVLDTVEFGPVEDLALAVLRARFPSLATGPLQGQSLIAPDQTFPLVLLRRGDSFGEWSGDPRFLDSAVVVIHTFCDGLDADEDAALLAEAVRVALRDAWLRRTPVPGRGHIVGFDMKTSPRRVSDWATATGPVQYADLPTGVHRYEMRVGLTIRKPRTLSL